ncbi:hypothetical protein Tco_0548184 [Tanacetum coccineum]
MRITSGVRPIPSIYSCRNEMGQGLAHRPVIVGVSRYLRGDSWGCVPRSLFWWEDLDGDGKHGFDYLTFALVSSKAHREGVGLRVVDSHTGNHLEGGFTPLETIQRLLVVIGRRSHSGFEWEIFEPERRMSADVVRGHGGDDSPPYSQITPPGYGGCMGNRGMNVWIIVRALENPIWVAGDRAGKIPARRPRTSAYWANYLGELVRELPLHHPSWHQVPSEEKAGVMAWIGTQFDMRPHMESDRWPLIYAAIQQHLQKIYNGKKAALKEMHWIPDSDGTYDLERIRQSRPSHISEMKSSATREYLSLIHTFFLTHTINGVFLNPEDKDLYDEKLRLQGLGSNTETGVPYTEDEIMAIIRGGTFPVLGDDEDDEEDGEDETDI